MSEIKQESILKATEVFDLKVDDARDYLEKEAQIIFDSQSSIDKLERFSMKLREIGFIF